MEFEDMKLIWDSQNNEPLYAINQEALYRQIQGKEKSIVKLLDFTDIIMIAVNLFVGILLIVDTWVESGQSYEYVLPIVYLGFFVYAIYRRFARKQEEIGFDETILSRLEKAIWQSDYLIKQAKSVLFWYLVPTMLVVDVTMLLNGKPWAALILTAVVLPLTYFAGRWEVERCHMPRKRELEALRETLLQAEEPFLE
jgi:hypothetical protein